MAADAVPILLKGCAKLMYTATLHVGDQYLDAVIDTGSSNLVLMGAECLGCSDTPRYIIQWHPLESLLAVLSQSMTTVWSLLAASNLVVSQGCVRRAGGC